MTHFETRKTGALLCCLALRPERAHSREVLAEQLWPDEDWQATRNRLRQALSALRRELEPPEAVSGSVLVADRSEVGLSAGAVLTDASEFERLVADAAQSIENSTRSALLQQAVNVYRGELLPGYYEEWILTERVRIESLFRDALNQLSNALAAEGDLPQAILYARRAVAADPLREHFHRDLMRLYAMEGRAAEALRQYRELECVLRQELGLPPSAATRALAEEIRSDPAVTPAVVQVSAKLTSTRRNTNLEPEGGAVPLNSDFYVNRPIDQAFEAAVARHDSVVLVKGARQMGKTSLLARGLQQARQSGAQVVLTDLQKLTTAQMESADALFLTVAEMMAEQLRLDLTGDSIWKQGRGWNVNFERFLRLQVLGTIEAPIVWGIDEVDRLFGHQFSAEVFGLFRSWHNERSLDPTGPWNRLTLVMAYATEAHLFITDLNQSPFNVGTRLAVDDFTLTELVELNRRYDSPLRDMREIERYYALVGGNPYLLRRGLHALTEGMDLAMLETIADCDEGCFADHLRRMLSSLRVDSDLRTAVRAVLQGGPCPSSEEFYRLRTAGIIIGSTPADAKIRCHIYRTYLEQHL